MMIRRRKREDRLLGTQTYFFGLSLAIFLGFFVFGKNKVAELMTHVHHFLGSARHAFMENRVAFDLVLRLGQVAIGAKHEFVNVSLDQILQRRICVRSIDNRTVRLGAVSRLRSQLGPKEFVDLGRRAVQRCSHIGNVGNDRFDTITGTFNFPKNCRHLVTIFRIVNGGRTRQVNDLSSSDWHLRKLFVL